MKIKFSKIKLLVASLIVTTFVGCTNGNNIEAANTSNFETKASKEVKKFVQDHQLEVVKYDHVLKAIGDGTRKNAKSIIIDARPIKKYSISHIPSAIAIPDTKFEKYYDSILGKVDKNKEIIVYCGGFKCIKSPKVAVKLIKNGHTNVKIYAAGMPQWKSKNYIELNTNVAKAMHNKKSALFIDARPYGKFAGSTIVGAISVPDTKFEKYAKFMPIDKSAAIITFCGGYKCHKSHSVANKLVALGYTNVKVYAAGFPSWKRFEYPTTGGAKALTKPKGPRVIEMSKSGVLQKGEDKGTVDGKWFIKNYKKLPKSVTLIDVRSKEDFASGTIPGAINVHAEKMTPKQLLKALPAKGDIVFFCGTGTRALEARGFLNEDLQYKGIDRIFYFDANIECNKNNKCTMKANDPVGI